MIEDPDDKSKLKNIRSRKTNQQKEIEQTGLFMSIREPFYYKEQVVYFTGDIKPPSVEDTETDCLAEFTDVYPFGYPAE